MHFCNDHTSRVGWGGGWTQLIFLWLLEFWCGIVVVIYTMEKLVQIDKNCGKLWKAYCEKIAVCTCDCTLYVPVCEE